MKFRSNAQRKAVMAKYVLMANTVNQKNMIISPKMTKEAAIKTRFKLKDTTTLEYSHPKWKKNITMLSNIRIVRK